MAKYPILIVEDQVGVRSSLSFFFKLNGYESEESASPAEALSLIEHRQFSLLLADMNFRFDTTSGEEGLDFIRRVRALNPELPIIAMTAWSSIDLAVGAMREGANDFIEKPWENHRLLKVVENQLLMAQHRQLSSLRDREADDLAKELVCHSKLMHELIEQLRIYAGSDAPVLLLGENGTGKSMLARQLHRWSNRRDRPMVQVNLGGLAASLFEAELFGHARGAFTDAKSERAGRFELADGGSLFMDEIGNVPIEQQAKLLRVVEDGELERLGSSKTQRVDVRLISATNVNLEEESKRGRFRRDLLYRINTLHVTLPPLRARVDDIIPLARHYGAKAATRYHKDTPVLAPSVERILKEYAWPGNVRELAHVMERAVLLAKRPLIDRIHFSGEPTPEDTAVAPSESRLASMTIKEAEDFLIRQALERFSGNLQKAAGHLGLTRQSFYRKLVKYSIDRF